MPILSPNPPSHPNSTRNPLPYPRPVPLVRTTRRRARLCTTCRAAPLHIPPPSHAASSPLPIPPPTHFPTFPPPARSIPAFVHVLALPPSPAQPPIAQPPHGGSAHQPPSPPFSPPIQVIARPGASFVRFPQRSFYDLMQTEEAEFGTTIQLMISRTLSEKLKEARVSAASFNAAAAAAASVPAAAVTVASTSAVSVASTSAVTVAPTSSVSVASAKAAAATAAPLLASGGPVGAPGAGTAPASVAAPPPAVLPSLPGGNSLSTPRPAARALGSRAQTPARSDHRAGPPAVSLGGSGATAGPPAVSPGGSATRLATPCDARVDDLNGEIERLTRQLIVSRQQLADL